MFFFKGERRIILISINIKTKWSRKIINFLNTELHTKTVSIIKIIEYSSLLFFLYKWAMTKSFVRNISCIPRAWVLHFLLSWFCYLFHFILFIFWFFLILFNFFFSACGKFLQYGESVKTLKMRKREQREITTNMKI